MLFDPVVVTVILLLTWQRHGRAAGITAAATTSVTTAILIGGAYWPPGTNYLHGIAFTTFARQMGTVPAPGILFVSGKWVGAVAVLAIIGAAVADHRGKPAGQSSWHGPWPLPSSWPLLSRPVSM